MPESELVGPELQLDLKAVSVASESVQPYPTEYISRPAIEPSGKISEWSAENEARIAAA